MPAQSIIPHFILYGEPLLDVELDFLHVETIHQRSSVNDWTIRAHAHPDQHQLLIFSKGSGLVQLEEQQYALRPFCVVAVPSLTVHEFRFDPGSDGFVVTVATSFFDLCVEGETRLAIPFLGHGRCFYCDEASYGTLADLVHQLDREFVWPAHGRHTAIKAYLQLLLVMTARLGHYEENANKGLRRRDAEIVVRYRDLVERTFRQHRSLDELASSLGVTTSRLSAACRDCLGKSAMSIVHDRLMIEAKRHLLYTSMTIGEIALSLGFHDPAYFNRFFRRRAGLQPGAYRKK